jgi:hypothetical protein
MARLGLIHEERERETIGRYRVYRNYTVHYLLFYGLHPPLPI